MPPINVWGQVGAVAGYIPISALTGLSGQLLGMNAAATFAEWKVATFLSNQFGVPTGSAAIPPYSFTGNLNMGIYADTLLNALSVTISGVRRFSVSDLFARFEVPPSMIGHIFRDAKGADIVAAANIDLGAATGNYVYITNAAGSITITRLGGTATLQSGTAMECKFRILGGSVTLKHDTNFLALPGGSDLTLGDGDICRFRKTNSADQFWELVGYSRFASLQITAAATLPTTLIFPDVNDRPAMVAGGWLPWNLNQQWGGAGCMPFHMVDAATGTEYKFDAFDGYIEDSSNSFLIGDAAADFYQYQSFYSPKALGLQALWLKLYKFAGNPVDNVTVKLWSTAAGVPNALIATANVINGKQITSDSAGQWYRFSFAVVQNLVANTQYIITVEKSGGVDAANYYGWKARLTTKYPNNLAGVGTAVPAWTATNTNSRLFICEAQASDQPVQTGGTFNGKIVGSEGNPINRSVAYCKPLRDFAPLTNPSGWTILIRGKTFTKDKTICDLIYGLHHDRINIRSAIGTGFVTVTVYESDGTVNTVAGTSDVSTNSYKDIMIVGRTMGDGADYIKIYVGITGNWTKENEITAQTFTLDPLMLTLGTGWIMGGFQLFSSATYTKLSEMTVLPSADGWTFTTTTATAEGSVFTVSAGKLNQIKAGMAAGGDGYYRRNALGFVNANGLAVAAKVRVASNSNTKDEVAALVNIEDGTKQYQLRFQEYYLQSGATSTVYYPQTDIKSTDCTVLYTGKGSDCFAFLNGKLVLDGTGIVTTASANNRIDWGDASVTANENADVIWDYIGYYNTSNVYPQFTSGELHEFAVFSGDQSTLGQATFNAGVPISIKQYCGIGKNFIAPEVKQILQIQGITSSPTTISTALPPTGLLPEQEVFVLGTIVGSTRHKDFVTNNTDQAFVSKALAIDGVADDRDTSAAGASGAGGSISVPSDRIKTTHFGLHKLEYRWGVSGGTGTAQQQRRATTFEARVL